jgi:multidrug resistance protein, MATE family
MGTKDLMMTQTTPVIRLAGGYGEVVQLASPVVLSLLSQTLMSAVDTAILGHFGTVEQGAAGLAMALLWPFLLSCNCSGAGVNIFVAQYMGAQRRHDCGAITWQGVYVSTLAWLPMVIAGLYVQPLVRLSAPSPELLEPTALYLRIRLLGGLPALLNFTLLSFFRGIGDTRTPLVVTLVMELLNAFLDVLLIFGYAGFPRLGIAGSAIGTVVATAVGTAIYLTLFLRRGLRQGLLSQPRVPFDRQACRRLVRVSWPVGAQGALELGAWMLFTALIARLGAAEAAAHAIATQVMSFAYMSGYGFSVAATTLVGQYLGAGNLPAARRSVVSCLVLVLVFMGTLGGAFFVWRYTLVDMFTDDATVITLGAHLLIFVALFQLFDACGLIATGVLRGAGDTRWPMLAGLVVSWGVFLPVAALAIFAWQTGITGAWAAALLYVILLGMGLTLRLLHGGWQQRSLA